LPSAKTSLVTEPYLKQIAGAELDAVMPAGILKRELEKIDEMASDDDVELVLASLGGDAAPLFRDLFRLLRSGDLAAAKARLELRSGIRTLAVDVPTQLDDAVGALANSDQIAVLNELPPEEMRRILQLDRFKEWMYFLHPDQKRYVEADYEKPVVLTGVSGSGKTCILVHRARYLARRFPGERIGIFTLNRNLAGLLRELVSDLLTFEERKNVQVFAFYDFFSELLHQLGADAYLQQLVRIAGENSPMARTISSADKVRVAREFDARSNETLEDTWDDFLSSPESEMMELLRPIKNLLSSQRVEHNRYLREEFTLVRSMWSPESRQTNYPGFDRGDFSRVVPFDQAIRFDILKLLLRYEEYMLAGGVLDVMSLTHALMPLIGTINDLPYEKKFRYVLIDEFQDFSNLDLSVLRQICTHQKTDSLFLAGDLVQKVLVKKLVLREAGFDSTAARWLRIRKNFRNSRQILAAAAILAKHYGELAKSKKEEVEILDPELAVRETAKPFALRTNRPIDKAWEIAYRMVVHQKKAPWTICIATANESNISVKRILDCRPLAVEGQQLSEDWVNHRDHVAVCTLTELKGFEFHLVIIVDLEKREFPSEGIPEGERWRDALRLYVGMTRARDELYLLFAETPSEFLEVMRDLLTWRIEDVQLNLPRAKNALPRTSQIRENKTWTISHEAGCADWFTPIQLRQLLDYYFVFVERVSNIRLLSPGERRALEISKDGVFKMWLKPSVLKALDLHRLYRLGKAGAALGDEIVDVCQRHGITLRRPWG
jgi:superfamily I DNA/RNA helicase